MKKQILVFFVLGTMCLAGCGKCENSSNVDMTVREIASIGEVDTQLMLEESQSAVVGILSSGKNLSAIGSGFAISKGGYILTNFHVVEGGEEVTLFFADKTKGNASLVWAEPSLDLAILKSSKEIPYLSTKNLEEVFVGDEVFAIGTPLTLQFKNTVTKGIVSATDRVLETQSSYGKSFLQNLIQHDASINPGNSGGVLMDKSGKVIGMNTLKASEGEGIGFAIPIEIAKVVVEKISTNNNFSPPYVGIFGFDSDVGSLYDENVSGDGVYVVSTKGEAKDKGLQKGDIIFQIDDKKIFDLMDFRIALYEKNIGDEVEVLFFRKGKENSINLKLEKRD